MICFKADRKPAVRIAQASSLPCFCEQLETLPNREYRENMQIAIPDELTSGLNLTPENARINLAIGLYADRRVTLGRAAQLAGMNQPGFLRKLGELRIPMHYDLPELEEDLMVVRETE